MIKLKELLKSNKKIKILIENDDYKSFLEYVKEEGCLWRSGEVIKTNNLKSFVNKKTIAITEDYLIYEPCNWMSLSSLQNAPEYLYTDLKENKTVDVYPELSKRTVKLDEAFRLAQMKEEIDYENKLKENRIISKLQIKYRNITNNLQRYFLVRYTNDDELLELFLIFKKFGYENIYNISLKDFNADPKVILVNNEAMTFSPASIIDCGIAIDVNKKIYSKDTFVLMMSDIFKEED